MKRQNVVTILWVFVFTSVFSSLLFSDQRSLSTYLMLGKNVQVSARTSVLHADLVLTTADTVFVQSDGTYKPKGKSAANVYLAVDGNKVSNDSLVDWRTSAGLTAHPFDAVGALELAAGHHTFELIAEPPALPLCVGEDCVPSGMPVSGGSFTVVSGASLSIFVHPAPSVVTHLLTNDKGPYNLRTAGKLTEDNQLVGKLPWVRLLSVSVPKESNAVAFGSGWVYAAKHGGDCMLSLLINGNFPGNAVAEWTNQDTWSGAESRGQLSTQAFLNAQPASKQINLATVEDPWAPSWGFGGENPAIYSVAKETGITVLTGMDLAGSATGDTTNSPNAGLSVGSSTGDPNSPHVGTSVELVSATIDIPLGSDGIVMFSAKSGTHGGDAGNAISHGEVYLWITIDGHQVGPKVFQEIAKTSSGSRRPIAASYLAAGSHALSTGSHLVQVWGMAKGTFVHAYMWHDLPLVWFN